MAISGNDRQRRAALDDDAIVERITRVHGIGRWSVEMLLIFHLRRPDVVLMNKLPAAVPDSAALMIVGDVTSSPPSAPVQYCPTSLNPGQFPQFG